MAWTVLIGICWLLALQGVSWMVIGSFDPLGLWDRGAARFLFGVQELPPDARAMLRWLLVPFGATDAAFFALSAELLRRGRAAGQHWVLQVFVLGMLVWFALDTGACLLLGAWWNVGLVNCPALLVTLLPAWAAARSDL